MDNNPWARIQTLLRKSVSPGHYQVWIRPLEASCRGDLIEITAPNEFVASWVRERLMEAVREAACEALGHAPRITVGVAAPARREAAQGRPADQAPGLDGLVQVGEVRSIPSQTVPSQTVPSQTVPSRAGLVQAGLVQAGLPLAAPALRNQSRPGPAWRFSFEDFVVGPSNELAYAASKGLCSQTLASDHVFICSAPGLGKTHLLQAIGQEMANGANRTSLRVAYLTAEEFASRLVLALKTRQMEAFRDQFREKLDLLLLEDIHFFQGKEKMQDELACTLQALRARGSKIVLSSSFLPRELSDVDPRLVSRFCSGFMTVIDKPDMDTRLKIVSDKARRRFQVMLPDDVSALLAEHIQSDVRQLESCLQSLVLKAQLLGRRITNELAWDVLRNYGIDQGARRAAPSIDSIVEFVCKFYGLSCEELKSKSRRRDVVIARNTAFFLARKHTSLSLKDIGQRFCRSHSTVIKGITNLEAEISLQTPLGRQVERTMEHLS